MSLNFVFSVLWILISPFSYGYHISALNGPQDVITCRSNSSTPPPPVQHPPLSLPFTPCIPMSDNLFGLLTASYTIGGFFGSILASQLADRRGKRNTLFISALSIAFGSLLMSLSNSFLFILFGRTIIGIGSGLSTVLVPIYLSQISPFQIRGSVGVMNQLAIVIGIFSAQLISLPLSSPFRWRWIFIISSALSTLQLLTVPLVSQDYQQHLINPPHPHHHPHPPQPHPHLDHPSNSNLSTPQQPSTSSDPNLLHDLERVTLLTPTAQSSSLPNQNLSTLDNHPSTNPLPLSQLLKHSKQDPALATGLKTVLITQVAQQLSGINAVLYYSTSIMKSVLPTQAIYISLFVTAINVIMTFPPIFLVDRLGRKSLLLISASSMAITSLILGFSINYEIAQISSLAIVLFVASFSVGLGPIPFVIISEVVAPYAVGATGSLGLAVNWAFNFLVGLVFLPLRNLMSSPDGDGDGNVFFIFTALGVISSFLIYRTYHPL